MRDGRKILCVLCILLLLCACGSVGEEGSSQRTEIRNGAVFTVDDQAGTVSADGQVYRYTVSGNCVTITYPDGSSWWWEENDNFGYGGWSDDYAPEAKGYADGFKLYDVLTADGTAKKATGPNPAIVILLFSVGLWGTISPYSMWYLRHGWRYKDAEPSEFSLGANRVCGIICLVIGVILLLTSI